MLGTMAGGEDVKLKSLIFRSSLFKADTGQQIHRKWGDGYKDIQNMERPGPKAPL